MEGDRSRVIVGIGDAEELEAVWCRGRELPHGGGPSSPRLRSRVAERLRALVNAPFDDRVLEFPK